MTHVAGYGDAAAEFVGAVKDAGAFGDELQRLPVPKRHVRVGDLTVGRALTPADQIPIIVWILDRVLGALASDNIGRRTRRGPTFLARHVGLPLRALGLRHSRLGLLGGRRFRRALGGDPGRALTEVIAEHGLFCALYADRGSHYWHTPTAGGKVDRDNPTQVGRALGQLGVELIPAYSPEARGRSERMFATLQDRLPKEFRLAGITRMDAANRFLADDYLPRHNARFARPPEEAGTAFVPFAGLLEDILCVQEERQVGNDNTVRYQRRVLQIPADRHRRHYVKASVRVHEYPDGTLAVFHGPRRLARYSASGTLLDELDQRAA